MFFNVTREDEKFLTEGQVKGLDVSFKGSFYGRKSIFKKNVSAYMDSKF